MPLQVLHGPINSGKTTRILAELRGTLGDRSGMLVVPSEATASELRRRLLKDIAAVIGDSIISWPKFLRAVANLQNIVLSQSQTALLVMKILDGAPLKYFRMKTPSVGICQQFAGTILTLKRNGIDVARLRHLLDTRGGSKESDLLAVFKRYEDEKKRLSVHDDGDLLHFAAEKIKDGATSALSGIRTIMFDEFPAYAPGHAIIMNALAVDSKRRLMISSPAPHSADLPYSRFLERGFKKIEEIADSIEDLKLTDATPAKPSTVRCWANATVAVTRSMTQEMRAVARHIGRLFSENVPKDDVVICISPEDSIVDDLLIEAEAMGLVPRRRMSSSAADAPLVNELLSSDQIGAWPEKASCEEFTGLCRTFATTGKKIEAWISGLAASAHERIDTAGSLQSLANLEGILKEMSLTANYLGVGDMRRDAFLRMLFDRMRQGHGLAAARLLPASLAPFEAGLATPSAHVIIPRLVDGVIPRGRPERLFFSKADMLSPAPDDVIDSIFPSAEDALALDSYLFDTFRLKCRSELRLLYPIIDESGSEAARSPFLDGYPDETHIPASIISGIGGKSAEAKSRLDHIITIEGERAKGEPVHAAYHGMIESRPARDLVRGRFTDSQMSATGLEKYAECPFAFFVDKVLGLVPREEELPELNPRDRGTIFHTLLERFYRDHLDSFMELVGDRDYRAKLRTIIEKLFDEVQREHAETFDAVAPGLRAMQRQVVLAMAMQVVDMEIDSARSLPVPLLPYRCEWGFGEGDVPSLNVEIAGEKPLRLHGWVDRIDVDKKKSSFLVVDYKTGTSVKSIKQDILAGLKLQLPVYVEAVRRHLLPGANPLGGLLIDVLHAEKRHGFVKKEFNDVHYSVGKAHSAMTDDVWHESIEASMRACGMHAKAIRCGAFATSPAKGCPIYCDYADACRHRGGASD